MEEAALGVHVEPVDQAIHLDGFGLAPRASPDERAPAGLEADVCGDQRHDVRAVAYNFDGVDGDHAMLLVASRGPNVAINNDVMSQPGVDTGALAYSPRGHLKDRGI